MVLVAEILECIKLKPASVPEIAKGLKQDQHLVVEAMRELLSQGFVRADPHDRDEGKNYRWHKTPLAKKEAHE